MINQRVSCISVDIINADKPAAGLAFLAGACEMAKVDYDCVSINSTLLDKLTQENFNQIYAEVKLLNSEKLRQALTPVFLDIVENIKMFNPTCIAASLFSYMQVPVAEILFSIVKQHLPHVPIIAGGPGISSTLPNGRTHGKVMLENNLIDFYCLGEGDQAFVDFLNGDQQRIGINSHQTKFESWVPQISDLDQHYIVGSYKKINQKNYKNIENKNNTVFSLSTSRGCVRNCSFCDVSKSWPKFRYRSGKSVAEEVLKHHQEVSAVNFTIIDSLINGSLKSFKDFNLEMIKLKNTVPSLKQFSYNGMFIIRDKKSHNEEFFALMKQAGCESLSIGVETGSDRLRAEMNKNFTNQDLDHHFEMCEKYNIKNAVLMFVGYPTETEQDFEQSLNLLYRYQKYLLSDTIIGVNHHGIFSMITDTPVYDDKDSIGIVLDHHADLPNMLSWHNVNNPGLTVRRRVERDLEFRKLAAQLRYPVPYSRRYVEYMQHLDKDFVPMSD